MEAKLTRASWKDKRVSSRIQVEGVYDLNMEPSILTPIEVKRQKYVKHLLTKSGPYGFTFKCSRSGFVKGHSLPFSVEIRNLSKVDSRKLRVSLLQVGRARVPFKKSMMHNLWLWFVSIFYYLRK